MSIDNVDDEIRCKVSDGHNWVPAVFHQRNKFNFESNRMKKNFLLRLINARLDQSHTLQIVSQSTFLCSLIKECLKLTSHYKIFH